MNKKLMALAVAGALGAPAAALAQNYSVYGRLTLGVDTYEAKGATLGTGGDYESRARVYDNGSRVGFRGTEDLGGGLQAVFLIETGVNVDNGLATGQGGQPNTSTGTWGSRIGHVGLAGGWGMFTYGRSNVWWGNGTIDQVGANWLNAGQQITTGGFGRGMGVAVARVSDLVQYTSPTFSGINVVASLSTNRAEPVGPGLNSDGKLYGLTVQGTHGPFAWGLDWATDQGNTPNTGGAGQGTRTGTKARAAFKYTPNGQVALVFAAMELENGGPTNTASNAHGIVANCVTATTQCQLKQAGFAVGWDHMFGPWHPIVWYGQVEDIKGSGCGAQFTTASTNATGAVLAADKCNQTAGNQITVALRYIFSKRTHGYVSYNKIDNDAQNNNDFNGASMTSRNAATSAALPNGGQFVGADPQMIAVGMIHNF